MFKGQSRHWSWIEVGYSSRTMMQNIPQNQPWSTSRKDRSWNDHNSPQPWIILKICGDLKHAVHTRRPKNISELGVLPGRMGKSYKRENWKTLSWQQEAFTSCYSCPRRSYKELTDRAPKLLHKAFFLVLLFSNCQNFCFKMLRNVSCLTLYHLEVRLASVHLDILTRLFWQGVPKLMDPPLQFRPQVLDAI